MLVPGLANIPCSTDIWTGNAVHCPEEHECYCKGYGICFGGKERYQELMDKKNQWYIYP